jgi:hypothetical protein
VFFAGFNISSLLLAKLPEAEAVGAPEVKGHPFSRHFSPAKVPQTPYDFSYDGCNGLRAGRLPCLHLPSLIVEPPDRKPEFDKSSKKFSGDCLTVFSEAEHDDHILTFSYARTPPC